MKFSLCLSILSILLSDKSYSCDAVYSCYNDSSALKTAMSVQDSSQKTFHVCADTTWNMGRLNSNFVYVNGDQPIRLGFSGLKVLCGPEGNVKDNCNLVGGDIGVEIESYGEEVFEDMVIEGFTFTGGDGTTSIGNYFEKISYIDLTVRNCHFVDNPKLKGAIILTTDHQKYITSSEKLTVEDCLFQNNDVVVKDKKRAILIDSWTSNEMSIVRSQFINNRFEDIDGNINSIVRSGSELSDGKGTLLSNATVSIKDSCFEGNTGLSLSLVLSTSLNESGIVDNNYQSSNTYVKFNGKTYDCDGVNYNNQTTLTDDFTCKLEGFEATTCSVATSKPSSMPTSKPSSMPSISSMPSSMLTSKPSSMPTTMPTSKPSSMANSKATTSLASLRRFEMSHNAIMVLFTVCIYYF
eukprot:CAMPEP_0197823440 /NCGR_PEP_ID=MMETSP1437-20131217/771_1 /TAXON_ID=49252 ORGANISM="Eucampia antarctica, Strain CCMP1452" /NCGR_SAMPLE_ID=MMETSP1437 /ASSEMBLY_ACC=CAM_ASM_001096 /LENGTH=408 /DNA_ID=CAMNT_0043422605 /DNA_START=60 /DNA_END=1286 /DNA_ORIENTATION=-